MNNSRNVAAVSTFFLAASVTHNNFQGNCRADEFTKAGALIPKSSSIDLGMTLTLVSFTIAEKFFYNANPSWVSE